MNEWTREQVGLEKTPERQDRMDGWLDPYWDTEERLEEERERLLREPWEISEW